MKSKEILNKMRKEAILISLKSSFLLFLAVPAITMLTILADLAQTPFPAVLLCLSILMVHHKYNIPKMRELNQKYAKEYKEALKNELTDGVNKDIYQ